MLRKLQTGCGWRLLEVAERAHLKLLRLFIFKRRVERSLVPIIEVKGRVIAQMAV